MTRRTKPTRSMVRMFWFEWLGPGGRREFPTAPRHMKIVTIKGFRRWAGIGFPNF